MSILDSGERTQFYDENGNELAVRDMHEGKGRCDLLPLLVIGKTLDNNILQYIGDFVYSGNPDMLAMACYDFISEYFEDIPSAMLELSIHYEEGSKKYSERNWENGIPLHSFIDSGVRHYLKFIRGDKDERQKR